MFKLIELTVLDGTKVLVNEESIRLFKYIRYENLGIFLKVDYAGRAIFTPENPESLLSRMHHRDMFAKFTVRSNDHVWINIRLISEIRKSIKINEPGTEIIVGGLYQHVVDDIGNVRRILEPVEIFLERLIS